MKVSIYPILMTSLVLLAGYTFYALYHSVAPKNPHPQKTITQNTISKEPIDLQKQFTLDLDTPTVKLPHVKVPPLEKEIQTQAEEIAIETPEETEAIYAAITPKNYEETMQRANEAFATVEAYAKKNEAAFLEEEANRNE